MRLAPRSAAVLAVALVSAACATGFDRPALEARLSTPEFQYTDEEVRAALSARPQLPMPCRVAVCLLAEEYEDGYSEPVTASPDTWRFTAEDRQRFEAWGDELRREGVVSDLFVMSELVPSDADLKSARLAAAKHGADAVLLVKGISQVDAYPTPLAVLNVLILPAYFIPANRRDALFILRGALWDVRNEYLYASVEAEGEGWTQAPLAYVDETDAIEEAKDKALEDFGPELVRRMSRMRR